MKQAKPFLILALITVAALLFVYKGKIKNYFWLEQGHKKEVAEGSRGHGPGMGSPGRRKDPNRVIPILVEPATTANIPVYLQGVGTVQASNTATVRAQVSGRLIAVNYREGQEIKKGDVLAVIDPVTYKAAYDQAVAKKAMSEAQLTNARLDLKRYEGLAKGNYATQQQADTQRAAVAQLEAQIRQDQATVDSAKANLDYTTIVAPIDGRTGIRAVDTGNLVTPNDTSGIVVITQVKPISVLFTLPETHVGDLIEAYAHGKVALEASVGGQLVGSGVLEVVDNRIDQTTGTVRLKGTFANETQRLWPGQFVNIKLHLKTLENATVVPAVALQQGANGRYVYVLQPDQTVKLTLVTVTQEDEKLGVIASGLAPGEKVATVGFGDLRDGAKVSLDDGKPGDDKKKKQREGNQEESEKPSGAAAATLPMKEGTDASSPQTSGGKVQ